MKSSAFDRTRQTMSIGHVLPALPKSLYLPEPQRKKPQRAERSGVLSVEQTAHMRYEREFEGATIKSLAQKYGISYQVASRLLDYTNRRHIRPAPPPGHISRRIESQPALSKEARNNAIYAAFNGRNHDALARQFSLSAGRVRGILNEQAALARRRAKPATTEQNDSAR